MKNKSLIIQLLIFFLVATSLLYFGSRRNVEGGDINIDVKKEKAEKIEVIYFHGTARCPSCILLEEYSSDVLNNNFLKEIEEGLVSFSKVNVDLPENREIAKKFQASGSSLKINEIIGGEDNISDEVSVWRYLNNKHNFEAYLVERISSRLDK